MKFKIKNIIIYPKDESKEPRYIPFELNKVNVLTGDSHKGKSAIIHILDYCLGSEKCTIPVDTIRDNVAFFAVHIITENSEIFIAREEPGSQASTTEMYLFEKAKIDLPSLLKLNNNRDRLSRIKVNRRNVVNRFNQIAGFSTQRFDDDNSQNKWLESASFRDTSAFQFQPQNIVANPTTLFYKADTYEHQNKLRIIFPLILGYETNEIIELKKEKKDLEQQLSKKSSQLEEKRSARDIWKNEVFNHYSKAFDFGLTNGELDLDNSTVDEIIYELEKITNDINKNPIPIYISGSATKFAEKLQTLIDKRSELAFDIDNKRLSLTKISQVNSSRQEYFEEVVKTKINRLKPIDWFIQNESDSRCPFCDSENHKATKQLLLLQDASLKLNAITNDTNLDREISILKKEILKQEEVLKNINSNLNSIYREQNKENTERKKVEDIYRFIGKIEEAIDNVKKSSIDGTLQDEIDSLKSDILEKDKKIRSKTSILSEAIALQNVTLAISKYTEMLDIERGKDPVKLDIQNLTIKVLNQGKNREDYFWEIGSGANHMGYHIATMLGLHEYFLSLHKFNIPNYVPSFIVFDQPSQVYFPKSIPEDIPKTPKEIRDLKSKLGEDFRSTMKIFSTCSQFMKRTKNSTQVIILEHTPELAWHGLDNVHLVEDWRNDKKNAVKDKDALIPKSWLE
ncbi:DUF3732 domain-containing protein [Flavobacterium sp. C3NV]|uniref:DUF3732 domain-containing protein n=1 Tax=Flavobacterium sp. C3NV TaxID=3393358 RepID=UPI00398FFD65